MEWNFFWIVVLYVMCRSYKTLEQIYISKLLSEKLQIAMFDFLFNTQVMLHRLCHHRKLGYSAFVGILMLPC
jgi:hypothetical protein